MRNKILMTLALLIMAVGGAWAQDTYNVTFKANGNTKTVENVTLPHTFKCDIYTEEGELDHIMKELYGLSKGCCRNEAPTSSGSENVTGGIEDENQFIAISAPFEGTATVNGIYEGETYQGFYYSLEITCAVYEPTEWSLTPDETGKSWTLDKMPASNVELQVEYYAESNIFLGKEALADKANIAVKNGETDVAFGEDGKSITTVTEGNTVTAKFTGKKVLGMKVEKKAPALLSIEIGGHVTATIYYFEGETWEQAIQNHPTENSAWKINQGYISGQGANLFAGGNYVIVNPNDTIDPKAEYHLWWT